MVIVGTDQFALLATLDRIGFDPERLVQQIGFACEAVIVTRRRRARKSADQFEIAIDLLLGEEAIEVLARELGLGQDRGRADFPKRLVISAKLGRRLPLVMPPLRDEAPSPGFCRSKTCTERPARASVIAAESPV